MRVQDPLLDPKCTGSLPAWLDLSRPVGRQVRTIRKALGMTQEQLAERSAVSQSVIAEIENGKREDLQLSTIKKLAAGLNCETLVQVIPKKEISQILDEQSTNVAQKIVSISSGSTAIERQLPDQKVIAGEVQEIKKTLLGKNRSALWRKI